MRLKKAMALTLASAMALSLTACGGGEKTETTTAGAAETTKAAEETKAEEKKEEAEETEAKEDNGGAAEGSGTEAVEFPAELNGGEPCTIRFAWWGGQTRHERTEAVVKMFMDRLKFICIVTHVADARTCVLHPASHTHRQLTDEQLREAGVAPDLIRLSVGIENVNDIIADIEQALQ